MRIRSESVHVKVLNNLEHFRRESVRCASLAAVYAALRQFDVVHCIADLLKVQKFISEFKLHYVVLLSIVNTKYIITTSR